MAIGFITDWYFV